MKKEIAFTMLTTTMLNAGEVQLIDMEKDSPHFIKYRVEMIESSLKRLESRISYLEDYLDGESDKIFKEMHNELEIIYFNLGHKTRIN